MESKIKKFKTIKELKEGDVIAGDIFVVKIKYPIKEYSNGLYFASQLTDNSGSNIEYKYWGGMDEKKIKEIYDSFKADDVIFINGKVSEYKNKLQISASDKNTIRVLSKEEYNEEDFILRTSKNIDEMYDKLKEKIELIGEEKLKNFIIDVLEEKDRFKYHPAAISIHHNFIGGLLEHTLEIISYCENAKKIHDELNLDLLIVGAIIHDIGKIEELEVTTRIKSGVSGQLVGHLSLGLSYIYKKLKNYDIDELTKIKILHIIASHHGKLENGAPITPRIPEALLIYFADEISCKVTNMIKTIGDYKELTEDNFFFKKDFTKGDNIFLR